jgi:hypothetical protein
MSPRSTEAYLSQVTFQAKSNRLTVRTVEKAEEVKALPEVVFEYFLCKKRVNALQRTEVR